MSLASADALALTASLARMGLLEAGEIPSLTVLAGGISSLIVRADTARGPVCIKRALPRLKVAAAWEAPIERNAAEVKWMRVAAATMPRSVPRILGHDEESHSFAMAYLDPGDFPIWKAQLRDGIAELATARQVALRLAAFHNATAHDPVIARDFANDSSFHALRLDPYFAATARLHADCAPALERLIERTASTRVALVHGDVSPKNILIGRAGPVFLDAECACYGDPAFDLAFCLSHLLLKCMWRPACAPAFIACFDALAQSYLSAMRWESAGALEARAAALLAALLLARVDGKSPVEYLTTESDRQRVRSFAGPLVRARLLSLAEVRDPWVRTLG